MGGPGHVGALRRRALAGLSGASRTRRAACLPLLVLALGGCSADPRPVRALPAPTTTTTPAPPTAPVSPDPLPPAAAPATAPPPAAPVPAATRSAAPPAPDPVLEGPDDPLVPEPALEVAPAPGLPACEAAALSLADADVVYGADTVRELFTLRTSGPDCQLPAGYPAARLLGTDGAPVAPVAQGGLGLPAAGADPVTLSRATSLSFFLATARDGPCTPAAELVVALEGAGGELRSATAMQVCGGALGVGPVQRLADDE